MTTKTQTQIEAHMTPLERRLRELYTEGERQYTGLAPGIREHVPQGDYCLAYAIAGYRNEGGSHRFRELREVEESERKERA